MVRLFSNILCLGVFVACLPGAAYGQQARNVKQEVAWLKNTFAQHHVAPKPIDDAFSADLFDEILGRLDPERLYLTKADLAFLETYRTRLDNEINERSARFLDDLKMQYKTGLERSEKLITALLDSPLDWGRKEMYDPKAHWAADGKELADRHRQWLKYQVLDRLAAVMQRDSATGEGFFERNLPDAIAYVRLTSLRPITRLLKDPVTYENEISDAFLESIASVFDPHSAFLSTNDYDNFVAALSTQDFLFGFMLDEDGKGNVIISALSPGGAAWKSGALRVSDILLGVRWENEAPIDLRGMSIGDINEILSTNPTDMLEMNIRGVDGTERKVTLKKEKQESDQNVVQSFILAGDIRVGYIYLPDFYTRWDDEAAGGRCANDVAKEVIKLKREGIDGIILDLRFNGGGSLFEARAMAGIFIDEGPLAMVTTRDKKVVTLKDVNRGTVYDGPLILMVNAQSASASEVLAASIQDYNRGLVVGSPTYGKATGQNLFPIDGMSATSAVSKTGESRVGYVKVTTQKLFRVTGKSAQGRGVTPDVSLPDVFSALGASEDEHAFALSRDSLPANPYFKPLQPLKKDELRKRSSERLAKDSTFQALQKTIAWVEDEMSRDSAPSFLSWDEYASLILQERKQQALAASFKSADKIYDVSNTGMKDQRLTLDEYARELNRKWQHLLTTDIYLQETYRILRDYLSLTKNP